jgi:[protein-PII] uridylyltransferase
MAPTARTKAASPVTTARDAVIGNTSLGGRELCRALAAATDDVVAGLWGGAASRLKARRRSAVALVAVGGYGRGELAPQSDVDLLLVHDGKVDGLEAAATALWYPLWDAGLKLGHAVRSYDDQLSLASDDLDTATAMLSTRYLAGDEELAARLATEGLARWRRNGRRWLDALRSKVVERRTQAGDVAYLLEPDLKDGHGGLRDVQTLWWAADADLLVPADDLAQLDACYATLVDVRVALHRTTGRPGDVLRLEDQDAVAAALGAPSADALMADVSSAGRSIVWIAEGAWRHVSRHQLGGEERVAEGLVVVDREVELAPRADVAADPATVLRAARIAAQRDIPLGRSTLDRFAAEVDAAVWREQWPPGALHELVLLLQQGHRAIDVLESLDQRGILVRLLPEWAAVRSRPQRNAYHRFTVDRHLWETAANAAALADRVGRPDLLVLGALFHDIGKGSPGDHTTAGMALVADIAPRFGLPPDDVAVLVAMVEHHLLLPDVAIRRDLTDPATIRKVADSVGTPQLLELLAALTEADSLATGPSAWGSWKAQLVADLVARTRRALDGGELGELTTRTFPDPATLAIMAAGRFDVRTSQDDPAATPDEHGTERLTVVCDDVPGTFARIAGVLSLRGLDVLTAWAYSGELGGPPMAASQFRVVPPRGGVDWAAVVEDLKHALDGQLAIEARLAERARTYRRRRPVQAQPPGPPAVTFHDDESHTATVIEVRAPNRVGVLHRIARALAEVGLDIRHATVQTLGEDVVDTFYVRGRNGRLVDDPFHRGEIERAVLHAVS